MQKEYRVYYSGRNFKTEGMYDLDDDKLKVLKDSRIAEIESGLLSIFNK